MSAEGKKNNNKNKFAKLNILRVNVHLLMTSTVYYEFQLTMLTINVKVRQTIRITRRNNDKMVYFVHRNVPSNWIWLEGGNRKEKLTFNVPDIFSLKIKMAPQKKGDKKQEKTTFDRKFTGLNKIR